MFALGGAFDAEDIAAPRARFTKIPKLAGLTRHDAERAAAAFEALAGLLPTTDAVRRFSWEHYKQDLADYRFASARQAVGFLSENRGVEVALRGCLIWRLCNILPASFDGVVARANVSPSQIAGAQAAQGSRAVDLVHLMSQRTDGLLTLANIVACVI